MLICRVEGGQVPLQYIPLRFHLRLRALAVKSARKRFIALVDKLPAAKIAPPATCLNLRFNQVGLRSRLRNLWFRTSRRACRWQRLKLGALPPPNPWQVSQETASIISDFLVRWPLLPNGTRRAGTNHRKMAALPQRGQSAVFPVPISGPPRSGVARVGGIRRMTPTIGL